MLFPQKQKGCSSLSLETAGTSHDFQVSARALKLVPLLGQETLVPPAMPGADMPQEGSGSARRRLAKMLLKLYHS